MSARFRLRSATAEVHERLDALYSRFDLADRDDYGRFLVAHAPAFTGVEEALDAAGATGIMEDWSERRRSDALHEDLAELGLATPAPLAAPAFRGEAELLGALYVLEGSRLGGAMLVRSVGEGLPTRFLTPGNPAAWRAFIAIVDERLSSEERLDAAIRAASAVFELFERSALAALEPIGRDD